MSFRSIVRDVRDGIGNLSFRRSLDSIVSSRRRTSAAPAGSTSSEGEGVLVGGGSEQSCWASLPSELLRDVIKRLEESESSWPARRHVVACAEVCRSWRQMCKEIVGSPEVCAKLTFPVSLKQPGPRNGVIQCYIKRNKAQSTYHLFLGLSPDNGKFLLAAKKIRRPARAEYIISIDAEDISRNSCSYMGKLKSNFLGTRFEIYDCQPPCVGGMMSSGRSSKRFYSRKVSPKVPNGSYGIAGVAYELNMLGTRGPRRMRCTMYSIPSSALEPGGCVPYCTELPRSLEESFSSLSLPATSIDHIVGDSSRFIGPTDSFAGSSRFSDMVDILGKDPLVLKNKAPRWHEQLQCWCLNFRGRVTVASVKNFQLIASATAALEPAGNGASNAQGGVGGGGGGGVIAGGGIAAAAAGSSTSNNSSSGTEHDKILLQFGKIGKDIFTMDYRYPLSAFQAFGICLSSFDTKLACE